MLRVIGFLVVVAAVVFGVGYYNGWVGGNADVNLTPEGKRVVESTLRDTRDVVSDGLDTASKKVRESDKN